MLVHCIIQTHFSDGKVRCYGTICFTEPCKDSLMWRRCCQNSWVWKICTLWCISYNTVKSALQKTVSKSPVQWKSQPQILFSQHQSCSCFLIDHEILLLLWNISQQFGRKLWLNSVTSWTRLSFTFFFIVVLCIFISTEFIHQQMHFLLNLKML
jgi:hypothetical protein